MAAARLGARVALVARVGRDERGARLVERLRAEGVETGSIRRDAHALSGVALVMVDAEGQKQILTAPGANRHLTAADIEREARTIQSARVLLAQLEVPLEAVTEAVRLAREAGALVALNPAPPEPLPDELLRQVAVVKPDTAEAEVRTGVKVHDRASARKAAERLLERGVGAAVVQAGDEGNLLVWREGQRWLPHLPVESVDATGAGDALAAALAVALAEGRALEGAAVFANAAAALATTALGAQAALPRRDQVQALLARLTADRGR